jgi:UDP-N-acetylglucosamine--N-acetylmuramyl-(pentapeptide) pyrophosphoryl-undecaprenol N-acetylglucosamine transferase
VLAGLKELLKEMQIIHLSGNRDWAEVEAARITLEKDLQTDPVLTKRYRAFPYLHDEMGAALVAADVGLSRSGASSLGEFPLVGLPAILVPYPHSWRYQKVNAEYLAQRDAALILEDRDLLEQLVPNVQDLIRDPAKRKRMTNAMRSLARPEAARSIAALLRGNSY